MSQTHNSDRDSASSIRTRVVSPRSLKVSASAATEPSAIRPRLSAATLPGCRWKTSHASSFMAMPAYMNTCSYVQYSRDWDMGLGDMGTWGWGRGDWGRGDCGLGTWGLGTGDMGMW